MLTNPKVGDALQELGAAIRYRSKLTDREREIAILTVAMVRRSEYEWYAHKLVGLAAGLTADEIHAVRAGQGAQTFAESEDRVRLVTERLLTQQDLAPKFYDSAVDRIGIDKLSDLVVLTGYYDLLSLMLRVWRTPLPNGVSLEFDTFIDPCATRVF